jgi:hypothetical protein
VLTELRKSKIDFSTQKNHWIRFTYGDDGCKVEVLEGPDEANLVPSTQSEGMRPAMLFYSYEGRKRIYYWTGFPDTVPAVMVYTGPPIAGGVSLIPGLTEDKFTLCYLHDRPPEGYYRTSVFKPEALESMLETARGWDSLTEYTQPDEVGCYMMPRCLLTYDACKAERNALPLDRTPLFATYRFAESKDDAWKRRSDANIIRGLSGLKEEGRVSSQKPALSNLPRSFDPIMDARPMLVPPTPEERERYAALEKEHLGDADKKTGIYYPELKEWRLPAYPCCEAVQRVEKVPGDAATLQGGVCQVHGLSVCPDRDTLRDEYDLTQLTPKPNTFSEQVRHRLRTVPDKQEVDAAIRRSLRLGSLYGAEQNRVFGEHYGNPPKTDVDRTGQPDAITGRARVDEAVELAANLSFSGGVHFTTPAGLEQWKRLAELAAGMVAEREAAATPIEPPEPKE